MGAVSIGQVDAFSGEGCFDSKIRLWTTSSTYRTVRVERVQH